MSTFPCWLWAWKRKTSCFQFRHVNLRQLLLINKKVDLEFKGLNSAAKVNLAFGVVLKRVEAGSCRLFYAYENITVMERSKLVCTPNDINNLKGKLQKMDIVDLCARERANTKWKFYKLTKLKVFAALLKDVPTGCEDSLLPEPLLKNQNVKCLTFWKKYKKALQCQSLPFQSSCSAFIWQREIGGRNIHSFQTFPEQLWGRRPIKVPGCSHDWYSKSAGEFANQYFSLRHWLCGWRSDWGTSKMNYSKVWKERQSFTLQQWHLLRQRQKLFLQIFLREHMWQNPFKDWKFGATFD